MSVFYYFWEFDLGIMGGWVMGNNYFIFGDILIWCWERGWSWGGGRKGRIWDGIFEDVVVDVV